MWSCDDKGLAAIFCDWRLSICDWIWVRIVARNGSASSIERSVARSESILAWTSSPSESLSPVGSDATGGSCLAFASSLSFSARRDLSFSISALSALVRLSLCTERDGGPPSSRSPPKAEPFAAPQMLQLGFSA